jgi:hypothetical protein
MANLSERTNNAHASLMAEHSFARECFLRFREQGDEENRNLMFRLCCEIFEAACEAVRRDERA